MKCLPQLFANNRAWAAACTRSDPAYFDRLCGIQRPSYLWIGCADSRVPANEIVGLAPGELFVHRNVSNIVRPDDPNAMAVVQYAVEALGVAHIIVCGHYGCGGIRAAIDGGTTGHADRWLAPVRDLARRARRDDESAGALWDRLCETNVVEQVRVLAQTDVVQAAWRAGRPLALHGWIYALADGLLRDLDVTVTGPATPPDGRGPEAR